MKLKLREIETLLEHLAAISGGTSRYMFSSCRSQARLYCKVRPLRGEALLMVRHG